MPSFFKYILKHKNKVTILSLAVSFLAAIPHVAHAGIIDNTVIITTLLGPIIFNGISYVLAKFAQSLFAYTLVDIIPRTITNASSPASQAFVAAWIAMRNWANILIVVALIGIALATILRFKNYEAQKMLAPLLIVAVLVNFSGLFVGFIIDASNIIMTDLIGGASQEGNTIVGNLVKFEKDVVDPQISYLFAKSGGFSGWGELFTDTLAVGALVGLLGTAYLITGIAFLYGSFLLVARYAIMAVLFIVSPLAFVFRVFPLEQAKGLWTQWWEHMLKWAFAGMGIAFSIRLSNEILTASISSLGPNPAPWTFGVTGGLWNALSTSITTGTPLNLTPMTIAGSSPLGIDGSGALIFPRIILISVVITILIVGIRVSSRVAPKVATAVMGLATAGTLGASVWLTKKGTALTGAAAGSAVGAATGGALGAARGWWKGDGLLAGGMSGLKSGAKRGATTGGALGGGAVGGIAGAAGALKSGDLAGALKKGTSEAMKEGLSGAKWGAAGLNIAAGTAKGTVGAAVGTAKAVANSNTGQIIGAGAKEAGKWVESKTGIGEKTMAAAAEAKAAAKDLASGLGEIGSRTGKVVGEFGREIGLPKAANMAKGAAKVVGAVPIGLTADALSVAKGAAQGAAGGLKDVGKNTRDTIKESEMGLEQMKNTGAKMLESLSITEAGSAEGARKEAAKKQLDSTMKAADNLGSVDLAKGAANKDEAEHRRVAYAETLRKRGELELVFSDLDKEVDDRIAEAVKAATDAKAVIDADTSKSADEKNAAKEAIDTRTSQYVDEQEQIKLNERAQTVKLAKKYGLSGSDYIKDIPELAKTEANKGKLEALQRAGFSKEEAAQIASNRAFIQNKIENLGDIGDDTILEALRKAKSKSEITAQDAKYLEEAVKRNILGMVGSVDDQSKLLSKARERWGSNAIREASKANPHFRKQDKKLIATEGKQIAFERGETYDPTIHDSIAQEKVVNEGYQKANIFDLSGDALSQAEFILNSKEKPLENALKNNRMTLAKLNKMKAGLDKTTKAGRENLGKIKAKLRELKATGNAGDEKRYKEIKNMMKKILDA